MSDDHASVELTPDDGQFVARYYGVEPPVTATGDTHASALRALAAELERGPFDEDRGSADSDDAIPDWMRRLRDEWPRDPEVQNLLSSDPHHVIVQTLLGHPDNLATSEEIAHIVSSDIEGALADLMDAGILTAYHQPSNDEEGLPPTFYGFTEPAISVLEDFNYLRGVSMARAVHEKTQKPERIRRHEGAPRPTLPANVRAAMEDLGREPLPDSDEDDEPRDSDVRISYEEGYGYSAQHLPSGVASQGDTESEALRALAEALTLHRRDEDDGFETLPMDEFLSENQTADELGETDDE